MSINTHDYPLSQLLVTAQRITEILSSWSEERTEQWAETYPDSVNLIIDGYGYSLFTHPEYASASPEEQQAVRDVFRSELEVIGKYADAELLEGYLTDLTMQGDIEYAALLVECLGDEGQMLVGSQTFGQVIENIFFAPQHNPEVTQEEAAAQIREILEDLADHPYADIAQLVDVQALATTMWDASVYGQLEVVDAIVGSLSDDAQMFVGPKVFGEVIRGIFYAPQHYPDVTQEDAAALMREILEDLADHPYADIAQLVDVSTLAITLWDASMYGQLEIVDAITDNLSDDAQMFVGAHTFGQVIENIAHTPQFNPEVTPEQAAAQIREILEDLADHPYSDIAQLVDVNALSMTMLDASMYGQLEVIDAITDNLSDDAQMFVGASVFGEVIKGIFYTPQHYSSVTQEAAAALIREILEDLADHPYSDIAQLVDVSSLSMTMLDASMYGQLEVIDAITDNLSDDAQMFVGASVFGEVIKGIYFAPQHSPEVTHEAAAAQIREILEDLADHPYMDVSQLVDVDALSMVMLESSMYGGLAVVDAIADNLSDDAQAQIGYQTFGEIVKNIQQAATYNNEVTHEEAASLIREIMEDLADHPHMDISDLVDVRILADVMVSAGQEGQLDVVEAITDNLSDISQQLVGFQAFGQTIKSIQQAAAFNSEVTQEEAASLIREIMEDLADHPHMDVAQLVDVYILSDTLRDASMEGQLKVIDAITDNLSDDAQAMIGPQTFGRVISEIACAGQFNPEVTTEEAAALIREIMEDLADHPHVGIDQLVDMQSISFTLQDAAMQGQLGLVDAITDNLNDAAQYEIGPQTFGLVIANTAYAGQFNPEVTMEEAVALVREIMEDLADHPHVGIDQLIDVKMVGSCMVDAAMQGQLGIVDAITDNLNDAAQYEIGPQAFGQVISDIAYAGQFNPEVTTEEAAALIREIMEDLADHPYVGIDQLVDMQSISFTLQDVAMQGQLGLVDAITDNLNDAAQYEIGPQTFGLVIANTAYAGQYNPEVTMEEAVALVREIMEDLADHPHVGIDQLIDVKMVGSCMVDAAMQGQLGLVDAITDNLNDAAQYEIGPHAYGRVIDSIFHAPQSNLDVTPEEASALIREIMEDLADHPHASISELVDQISLEQVVLEAAAYKDFETADAVLDNLDTQALEALDTDVLQQYGVSVGTESNDFVYDTAGEFEAIYGLAGDDFVIGCEGDTALFGGDGNDYVYDFGSTGDDTISGGDGSDFLYGGAGADTFVFHEGETGVDTVYNFSAEEGDKLDISEYLEQYDELQHAIDDFVILTDNGNGTTVSVDVDGQGGQPAQEVAILYGTTGLEVADVIDITATDVV